MNGMFVKTYEFEYGDYTLIVDLCDDGKYAPPVIDEAHIMDEGGSYSFIEDVDFIYDEYITSSIEDDFHNSYMDWLADRENGDYE